MIKLMPHQEQAVLEMHNGSVLKGEVGSGKSLTAIAYYYMKVCRGLPKMPGIDFKPMENPMDLYIITTAKKRDKFEWEMEGGHFGLFRESDLNGVQMHVDSWNNINQYELVTDAFFIFDEQRLVGSGAWVKAFLQIAKNNQWIILSATPGDTWMDYIPIFIANGFYKNRTEFIRRHVVFSRFSKFPKVERFVETGYLERLRDKILVDMPYERHTVRHENVVMVEYDAQLYKQLVETRFNPETEEPFKDVAEFFAYCRKVTNQDTSRLGEILRILESHPRLIIFYNFNYELEILRTLRTTLNYPLAEWNGQKHEEIPDTDKWIYLVQYTAGAEGWNCITTDAIAFYSLPYSWKAFHQSKGRIDRLNTKYVDLFYYILRSASPIDRAIWKTLMTKKSFNEKRYEKELWGSNSPFRKDETPNDNVTPMPSRFSGTPKVA
ncbi:DNA helicase [Microbacterium phage Count]|nr:DNA helicase [Microbacterium phage Count]